MSTLTAESLGTPPPTNKCPENFYGQSILQKFLFLLTFGDTEYYPNIFNRNY